MSSSFATQAQSDSLKTAPKTELKLNLFSSALRFPEVSLERNFAHVSFGSSLGLNVSQNPDISYPYSFMLTPFFRYFPFGKNASRFFIESYVTMLSANVKGYDNSIETQELRTGLGLSLGGKHIFGNNMVLEYYTGLGRDILGHSEDFFPRVGIALGWRLK